MTGCAWWLLCIRPRFTFDLWAWCKNRRFTGAAPADAPAAAGLRLKDLVEPVTEVQKKKVSEAFPWAHLLLLLLLYSRYRSLKVLEP